MPAVLHWFRHDLRLHDNAALQASLALAERDAGFGDGRARVNGPEIRDADGRLAEE